MRWRLRHAGLDLTEPRVMAIINATPDSFYAGSRTLPGPAGGPGSDGAALALERAAAAVASGADMLDIGGESTRPGAERIGADEQIRRVAPAIRAIREAGIAVPISVDTTLASVANEAIAAGADAINDVSAGTEDRAMLDLAARTGCGLVLMHRLAAPGRDRYSDGYSTAPVYHDVVSSVRSFLADRVGAAIAAGVAPDQIVVDPGLGFGKSVAQNMELIRRTAEIAADGRPVLSGLSRKSFVGRVSLRRDSEPSERLPGTLALSVAHLAAGARIFRVHDVAEHLQSLRAAWAAARTGAE